jgi:streptomycin 6-kinase
VSKPRGARFVALTVLLARRRPDVDPSAIPDGRVLVDGRVLTSPVARVRHDAALRVLPERRLRGDIKLSHALDRLGVDVAGRLAVDVGAGAGGFTTALLDRGARRVYAVDAGVGQLLGRLRSDPRVVNLERHNLAAIDTTVVPEVVELVTVDLSYLAVADAVPQLEQLDLDADADLVALVKPTFELRRSALASSPQEIAAAVRLAAEATQRAGWTILGQCAAPATGQRGAREVFLHARRRACPRPGPRGFPLPRNLVDAAEQEGRQAWLATLPATVKDLEDRWSLQLGEPFRPGGRTAWVAPARARDDAGVDLVLKVAWRHPEAAHEADGLREWNGDGAVRLHATEEFEESVALLLERCVPGTMLASRPEREQDTVMAGLLLRLWREPAPGHRFRPLQVMCDAWAEEFEHKAAQGLAAIDPGLARLGVSLFRTLPATAERTVLLCTDLHAENVVAAEREPWLVIDPKPYVGDPTYDPLQHLLNCDERLRADPVGLARRMAELLGLDAERLLLWLFARCVQESPDCPWLGEVARRIAPR